MGIIGLEERFVTSGVLDAWRELDPRWQDIALKPSVEGESARRLAELGGERFAAMEESGLDVQVVSLSPPGVQNLAPEDAVALQTASNDLLADAVGAHPDRLQGLAALATPAPAEAARELERAVTGLGTNGANHGDTDRPEIGEHNSPWSRAVRREVGRELTDPRGRLFCRMFAR